jgi:hypothetical protein
MADREILAEIEAVRACGQAPGLLWYLNQEAARRTGMARVVIKWRVADEEGGAETVDESIGAAALAELRERLPGVEFWAERVCAPLFFSINRCREYLDRRFSEEPEESPYDGKVFDEPVRNF